MMRMSRCRQQSRWESNPWPRYLGSIQPSDGATENARPDIARLDSAARHHIARVDIARLFQCTSTCSLQVYFWFREYYMSCSSVLCS